MKLTLIIPCFNEQEAIPIFMETMIPIEKGIKESFQMDITYIFVDDGSKDKTLPILMEYAKEKENIKYLSFSRNFGKEAAIYAGLKYANSDLTAILDVDLQDPPALLPEMITYIREEGYDSVATRRITRKGEPKIRSLFARCFYRLINRMSKTEVVDGARDYRMMNKKFVNALLMEEEYNRFSKGLYGWVGFKTKWIEFENVERSAGETKWSFWKLLIYAIEGIVAFSTTPLVLSTIMGLLFGFLSFVMIVFIIVRKLAFGDPIQGWASIVSITLLIGGIQMISIGIVGQYLSKTYLETKRRPIFILDHTNINAHEMMDEHGGVCHEQHIKEQ